MSALGRRAEALALAQEAVELYRALVRHNPDAFQPDLARSLLTLSEMLSNTERYGEAAAALVDGIYSLQPQFCQLPEVFGLLMGALVGDYLKASRTAGAEPDLALLAPIVEILQRSVGGERESP